MSLVWSVRSLELTILGTAHVSLCPWEKSALLDGEPVARFQQVLELMRITHPGTRFECPKMDDEKRNLAQVEVSPNAFVVHYRQPSYSTHSWYISVDLYNLFNPVFLEWIWIWLSNPKWLHLSYGHQRNDWHNQKSQFSCAHKSTSIVVVHGCNTLISWDRGTFSHLTLSIDWF